jgi:uncharacterized protein (DUF433 family)
VSTVFANIQDMNVEELIEEFGVTREQVQAVLEFAAQSTESPSTAEVAAVNAAAPGSFTVVEMPRE